jgi:uncharacterized protein YqeY
MAIKEQVQAIMKEAMKAKDKARLSVVRLILADFKRIEVDERITLDETRELSVLDKMLKQRRDSISQFEKAGREDLAEQERYEIEVIQHFMPKALTEDEVLSLVQSAITEVGAQSMKDMGKVMAILKPKLQGRTDMGKVSAKIKAGLEQPSA